MATLIDALLVSLNLDPSGFEKGRKETSAGLKKTRDEATQTQKDFEAMGKNASQAFGKIRDQVLGLTAAMLGAAFGKQFVERITASDTATNRLSKNVGSSSTEISTWTGVAEQAGGTAEGMAGSIGNLSKQMQQLKLYGHSAIIPFLSKAKIEPKFLNEATSWSERLLLIADAFKSMEPATAQILGGEVGIDERTVAVLMHTREALAKLAESQRAQNAMSKEDGEAADKRAIAWKKLEQALTSVGRAFTTWLTPALEWVLNLLAQFPKSALAVGALVTALGLLGGLRFVALIAGVGGTTAALVGAAAAGAGLLGLLVKIAAAGGLAHAALSWLDPSDKFGDWMDRNVPGASWLDNQASRIGMGRSYAEQGLSGGGARTGGASGSWDAPSGGTTSSGAGATRGMRNNNPGNLNFAGQAGATKEGGPNGRFARFGSMDEGVAALARQLQLYAGRGIDTVRGIIGKYAPPGENNTEAYVGSIMKRMGVGADQHLDLKNLTVLREMIGGISTVENGAGRLGVGQINSGLNLFQSQRYGSGANRSGGAVHVDRIADQIHIHTQAKDAEAMAREAGPKLRNYTLAVQANTGLN